MSLPSHEQQFERSYEERVQDAFYFWGRLICERSSGDLIAVDPKNPDPDDNHRTYMDLTTAYYPAEVERFELPGDHEWAKLIVNETAEKVLHNPSDFIKLTETFREQEGFIEELRAMVERPEDKHENWLVIADHSFFMNIALLEGAIFCAVDKPGFGKHLAITVSKTLGFMDAVVNRADQEDEEPETVPVILPLQSMGHVFTTVPPSDSTKRPELEILKDFSTNHDGNGFNFRMTRPYMHLAKHGNGLVSVIAPSASLDFTPTDNPSLRVMKAVDESAAKLLSKTSTKALVISTHRDEAGEVSAKIVGTKKIEGPDDIHDAMQMIVPAYQEFLGTHFTVVYDDPRNQRTLHVV